MYLIDDAPLSHRGETVSETGFNFLIYNRGPSVRVGRKVEFSKSNDSAPTDAPRSVEAGAATCGARRGELAYASFRYITCWAALERLD
jgi:hypothetical protein